MTQRADRVLAQLMDAYERGDLTRVEALASQLGTAHPELRAWSTYVEAGVKALGGEPDAGLRLLAAADESGGWWSPALLADPALATIWPLDDRCIRTRSEERWRAAQERAEVSWDVVRPSSPPQAVVISLHGNGPAPADLFRSLWAELESCATFLVRSPQLVACNVYEWRDRNRAIADVRTVATAVRAEFGSTVPLILAGLGAGGRIAIVAALTGAVEAAGAVAFAPYLAPLDDSVARSGPRISIFPGGSEASVTSCGRFAAWARACGLDCTIRHEDGMGHAFPVCFGATTACAVGAIIGEDLPTTPR
jgi:predicted esterase